MSIFQVYLIFNYGGRSFLKFVLLLLAVCHHFRTIAEFCFFGWFLYVRVLIMLLKSLWRQLWMLMMVAIAVAMSMVQWMSSLTPYDSRLILIHIYIYICTCFSYTFTYVYTYVSVFIHMYIQTYVWLWAVLIAFLFVLFCMITDVLISEHIYNIKLNI